MVYHIMDLNVNEKFNIELVKRIELHKVIYDTSSVFTKHELQKTWENIARDLKINVDKCKLRWRNIRHVYRRYLKRNQHRIDVIRKPYYLAPYLKFFNRFAFKSKINSRQFKGEESRFKRKMIDDADEFDEDDDDENNDEQKFGDGILIETPSFDFVDYSMMNETESAPAASSSVSKSTPSTAICQKITMIKAEPVDNEPSSVEQMRRLQQLADEQQDSDLNFFKSLLPELKLLNALQRIEFRTKVLSSLSGILAERGASSANISAVSSSSPSAGF